MDTANSSIAVVEAVKRSTTRQQTNKSDGHKGR